MKRKSPKNGEWVIVKVKSHTNTTSGVRHNPIRVVPAIFYRKPFPAESASFYSGHFQISDDDAQWHHADVIEWVGFSGRGVLP